MTIDNILNIFSPTTPDKPSLPCSRELRALLLLSPSPLSAVCKTDDTMCCKIVAIQCVDLWSSDGEAVLVRCTCQRPLQGERPPHVARPEARRAEPVCRPLHHEL